MNCSKFYAHYLLFLLFILASCGSDEKPRIDGCTDEVSVNFDPDATHNDGSCIFPADMLVGDWNVTEEGTFFNGSTFQTSNLTPISYNATITASDKTEISIETDRSSSPPYDYDGPLTVIWEEGELEVVGTSITGEIIDEDHFTVTYTYGVPPGPGTGLYTIERTYVRD